MKTPINLSYAALQMATSLTNDQKYYLIGNFQDQRPSNVTSGAHQALEDLCYLGLMNRDFDGYTTTFFGNAVKAVLPGNHSIPRVTIAKGKPIWIRKSGRWGVKVTSGTPIRGEKVLITTRAGKSFEKLISSSVWTGWSNFDRKYISICETTNIKEPRALRAKSSTVIRDYELYDDACGWCIYHDFDDYDQDQLDNWMHD